MEIGYVLCYLLVNTRNRRDVYSGTFCTPSTVTAIKSRQTQSIKVAAHEIG